MTDSLLAIDIETMPVVDDPDFDDPSHWRVLAIALGSRSKRTDLQTTVLLRRSDTPIAEYLLIDRAIMWLQARTASTICTYNGTDYDIPILRHRARETMPIHIQFDTSVPARLDRALDAATHRDLFREIRDRRGETARWPSLEDACHEFGIDTSSACYERDVVTGSDVPRLGANILDVSIDSTEAEQALRDYAREDVRPLLMLADALDQEGSA